MLLTDVRRFLRRFRSPSRLSTTGRRYANTQRLTYLSAHYSLRRMEDSDDLIGRFALCGISALAVADTAPTFYNYLYTFGLLFGLGLHACYQKRSGSLPPQIRRFPVVHWHGRRADPGITLWNRHPQC